MTPWFQSVDDIAAQVLEAGGQAPDLVTGLAPATLDALNDLATRQSLGTVNGTALRFCPADDVAGQGAVAYEQRIAATGRIATRTDGEGALHDWFNALVWLGWPRTKAALNAAQARAAATQAGAQRSPWRDALTLFDENGALFVSDEPRFAAALREQDWLALFQAEREAFSRHVRIWVLGHGLLQKLTSPYKGICAHALIIDAPPDAPLSRLDSLTAARIGERTLSKAVLQPLPLLGVPGWWPENERLDFYLDTRVFRTRHPALARGDIRPNT